MKKQEESSDPFHIKEPEPDQLKTIGPTMALVESSGLRYQDLHARNIEEETEADIFELTESSDLRYQKAQVRNLEEETEADRPEPEMKKKKESFGSLSMKEPTTKLVTNKQKENSDNPSMKKLERGCGRKMQVPNKIVIQQIIKRMKIQEKQKQ